MEDPPTSDRDRAQGPRRRRDPFVYLRTDELRRATDPLRAEGHEPMRELALRGLYVEITAAIVDEGAPLTLSDELAARRCRTSLRAWTSGLADLRAAGIVWRQRRGWMTRIAADELARRRRSADRRATAGRVAGGSAASGGRVAGGSAASGGRVPGEKAKKPLGIKGGVSSTQTRLSQSSVATETQSDMLIPTSVTEPAEILEAARQLIPLYGTTVEGLLQQADAEATRRTFGVDRLDGVSPETLRRIARELLVDVPPLVERYIAVARQKTEAGEPIERPDAYLWSMAQEVVRQRAGSTLADVQTAEAERRGKARPPAAAVDGDVEAALARLGSGLSTRRAP